MPYDQTEAFRRFEGLLKLWERLHERIKNEEVTTQDAHVALAQEARHLVDAFCDEVALYEKLKEAQYPPTIAMIMDIQTAAMCVGSHLKNMQDKLDNIDRGKAAFTEMLGPSPKKTRVWN